MTCYAIIRLEEFQSSHRLRLHTTSDLHNCDLAWRGGTFLQNWFSFHGIIFNLMYWELFYLLYLCLYRMLLLHYGSTIPYGRCSRFASCLHAILRARFFFQTSLWWSAVSLLTKPHGSSTSQKHYFWVDFKKKKICKRFEHFNLCADWEPKQIQILGHLVGK